MSLKEIIEKVKKVPYQEMADSPTEKYYTDWRKFEKKLDAPDAENFDNIDVPENACVIDPVGPILNHGVCSNLKVEPLREAPLLNLNERLAVYHTLRSKKSIKVELGDGTYILLLRGGEGYVGYNVEIKVRDGSKTKVLIIDTALSDGLKTQLLQITLGEEALLDVYHVQLHSQRAPVYSILEAVINRASRMKYRLASRPGEVTRHRLITLLEGSYSRLDVLGGVLGKGRSQGDYITDILHFGESSVSVVDVRGISTDYSNITLRGTAKVLGKAEESSTRVLMHVLIAGENAKGRSVPMLEIYTGNMQEASHSASATSIGEEILFYAASRGLSKSDLVSLVEHGLIERAGVLEELLKTGLRLDEYFK